MNLLIYFAIAVVLSATLVPNVFAHSEGKGLKVFLTVGSNQFGQQGTIQTSQFGNVIDTRYQFINQGSFEYELNYQKGQIEESSFQICVTLDNGVSNCSDGYNGQEKAPAYVHVNLHGDTGGDQNDPSQSQSQSSSNSNENNNALSQSQETTIWICKEGGCTPQ